jgi:Peptidase C65 Otubain
MQDPMSVAELYVRLLDESLASMLIMLVRMITSAEVQRRSDHFTPFILGMTDTFMGTPEFCRRFVEAMGEESDHIQLVAVADAFQARAHSACGHARCGRCLGTRISRHRAIELLPQHSAFSGQSLAA